MIALLCECINILNDMMPGKCYNETVFVPTLLAERLRAARRASGVVARNYKEDLSCPLECRDKAQPHRCYSSQRCSCRRCDKSDALKLVGTKGMYIPSLFLPFPKMLLSLQYLRLTIIILRKLQNAVRVYQIMLDADTRHPIHPRRIVDRVEFGCRGAIVHHIEPIVTFETVGCFIFVVGERHLANAGPAFDFDKAHLLTQRIG